jgi:hypothetical protein
MESTTIIKLQSLEPYRHLFPKARAIDNTVKMGATVSDTVEFIPMVIKKTQWQVEQFVNQELRGLPTYEACEKLWHFVKNHIRYKKDERGIEQVRSARRLIHDAVGDCDCFTTFIGTCLSVLNIPIINRITKYKQNFFQHIYPIVPLGNGSYITMDCVVDEFNYEEPYTEKKDYKMDLQYLDGIEDDKLNGSVDARDLFGWENDMGDLGKLFKRQKMSEMPEENQGGQSKRKGFQKFKNIGKRVLNVANKANPATALLRAGILASMKLNIMKVPQRLKWAYLTEAEAKQKGADMTKFSRLKKVLYKIEQIFFTAGGNPKNLRKSILTGRGNRNKEVNGLGIVDGYDMDMSGVDENSSLSSVLGATVYQDEFVNGLEGTEGLGSAVATGAAVTAATTVMATIATLLKSIGNLFPNKKANNDFKSENKNSSDEGNTNNSSESSGGGSDDDAPRMKISSNGGSNNSENSSNENSESNNTPSAKSNNAVQKSEDGNEAPENNGTNGNANKGAAKNETEDEPKKGFKEFWENNKKWMKPLGIGLGAATVLYIGYRAIKGNKENKGASKKTTPALNGIGKRRKSTKGKHKGQHGKKSNVALM